MGLGRACIVTDHGSFAEYPDDAVAKIPAGEQEVPALVDVIRQFALAPDLRDALGRRAKDLILRERSPRAVAAKLHAIIEGRVREEAQQSIIKTRVEPEDATSVRHRLQASLEERLPSHLRSPHAEGTNGLPTRMSLALTAEEIHWTFRVLLERDPHPELEVPKLIREIGSLQELRRVILGSEEYDRLSRPRQ